MSKKSFGADVHIEEGSDLYLKNAGTASGNLVTIDPVTKKVSSQTPAQARANILGSDINAALTEANSPSATNVFATSADIIAASATLLRQVFVYSASNVFTLSYAGVITLYVALNGQVLEEGPSYDWVISGTQLTVTTPLTVGDEISIRYYTSIPMVAGYGRNIDGGTWDSVYLPIQNVDGGSL